MGLSAPLLSVSAASVTYGAVRALDEVTFDVAERTVTSVIGPNGAGKTSLFNAISGLSKLSGGAITYDGRRLDGARPDEIARQGIARTFQNLDVFSSLTVLDNVRLGRHAHMRGGPIACGLGLTASQEATHDAVVHEILNLCDLGAVRHERVAGLAYGLQKRVEIARAIAMEPRLMLLDEPAAGMHVEEKQLIGSVIARLRATGVTVLVVEHDVAFVSTLSDAIVVLDFGRQIASGPPHLVLHDEAVRHAYLGAVDDQAPVS